MARNRLDTQAARTRDAFIREHAGMPASAVAARAKAKGVLGVTVPSVYYVRGKSKSTAVAKPTATTTAPTPALPSARTSLIDFRRLALRIGLDAAKQELSLMIAASEAVG